MLKKPDRKTILWLTWICRIIVGATFILSGFTKSVDPWGTVYKLEAYAAAMSVDVWTNLTKAGAFILGGMEFVAGIMVIAGCFRRTISIACVAIMSFMLPLTLWIAVSNPVSDCGCFGDAIILSNWATFWKNVVLMAASLWLLFYNKRCHWIVTPALQWLSLVATSLFIIVVETFGFLSQPLIDFRNYKTGEALLSENSAGDGEGYQFVYRKGDEEIIVGENDPLPSEEDGWVFSERREIAGEKNGNEKAGDEKTFRIWDKDSEEDISEEVVAQDGKTLLVMIPDLARVSPATTWKLNSLYSWAKLHNVAMAGVVAGSPEEIEEWEDLSMASYPIYTSDDTAIKEVVRGNPGIVYIVDGIIKWKSTLTAIDIDDFQSPETSSDASSFALDSMRILRNCLYVYIIVMAFLVFLSFSPMLRKIFKNHS